jgi:hypothetical protein
LTDSGNYESIGSRLKIAHGRSITGVARRTKDIKMAVINEDIQREQQEAMPREDLKPYAGQWVALRDGRVVDSDLDPVALQNKPTVREGDSLIPVPANGTALLML